MKILTFLGAGTAYETTYVMPDGRDYTAPFFGVALARFYPDSDIRVFVTEAARERHLEKFASLTEDFAADITPVDISDGRDEEELWHIFQAVVDNVEEDEKVLFDITHGFRSLPFLSFLAAAYLREVKNIQLTGLLYGNFEARDKSMTPNRAPVIDLTRFVDLLDWMIAADRFTRFGDARDLANQLRKARPDYRAQQRSQEIRNQAIRLSQAAKAMDNVSLALRLIRPAEAMDASESLQQRLSDGVEVISQYARPFQPLTQRVTDAYAPLAMSRKAQENDPQGALARERRMVQWYLERGQYVQAMAVAREWIISWAMWHLGFTEFSDKEMREEIERALGEANKQRENQHGQFGNRYFETRKSLQDIPEIEKGLDLYREIGATRNDLLHAGKRTKPKPADQMEKTIEKLCAQLQELPLSE